MLILLSFFFFLAPCKPFKSMNLIFSVLLLSHFCNFQSGITEVRTYRIRDFLSRNLFQAFSESTIIALCLSYYRKLTMYFINAITVVLQHLYFNNLFRNLGVTIWRKNWVQNVCRLVFVPIRFPERILLQSFFLRCSFTFISSVFSCRYVCWEVCIAHCFRKFRVNLMYVNLTSGKFALILCTLNFFRVVNVHR